VVGVAQTFTPEAIWWLPPSTVYALGLVLIAAVYLGFAVADGRAHVLAVETTVVTGFVILAAAALTGSPWLLVAGFLAHGFKDLWQHRTGFVDNTRWWPPFCATVDFLVAALLAIVLAAGNGFS
jgi:hypothetical protein